jgi:hypothetical protein
MIVEDMEKKRSWHSFYKAALYVSSSFGPMYDQYLSFWCPLLCKTCQLCQCWFYAMLYLRYDSVSIFGSGVGLLCLLDPLFIIVFLMCLSQVRKWRILCWNVRGLNADNHQRALRSKIEESQCFVICIQETKCENIDHKFIIKFCHKRFDTFAYSPSVGASGWILVVWNSSVFSGDLIENSEIFCGHKIHFCSQ